MRILVDTVLFQLRAADTADARACARVLAEMAAVAAARNIGLTLLDRGGMPDLGPAEIIRFPSYKASASVADGDMLDRMGRHVGADAFVSTALTMLPSLPNVQLLFGDGEEALLPGREGPPAVAECEIALAFSSALVFASRASEQAFRSRFPRRPFRGSRTCDVAADDPAGALPMAEAAVGAAVQAIAAIEDSGRDRRFLALRRMQAAFDLSDASPPAPA